MDCRHYNHKKQCQKNSKCGKKQMEDRKSGIQPAEALAGEYRACSWNEQAQKNHYLMEQIADFIKQLYEYYYLKKNEINLPFKTNKNFA